MKLPQLICLITLGAALSTGAWSAAAQSTPTPTATPATPQAEAGVLLDSLYPGGVPADAQPKPRAAAASAGGVLLNEGAGAMDMMSWRLFSCGRG